METATRNLKELNKGNYVILYLKIGGSWKMPQAFSGNKTNHLKSKGNISELKNQRQGNYLKKETWSYRLKN